MPAKHIRMAVLAAILSSSALAQDVRFDITRFQVEGNSLLPQAQVNDLVVPFAGRQRVYGDVQKALEALENAYRKAGYGTVQVFVPEQELAGGVVRLVVTEAVVGKVAITGNKHYGEANIRRSLPALQEGRAPNMRELSEAIQLANENPTKQIEVTLGVAQDEGRVDAKINVSDEKPQRWIATLDNTGTENTGRHRLGLAWQHTNLFDADHILTLAVTGAPDMPSGREVSVYSAAYRFPMYGIGDAVDVVYGKSTVNAPVAQATGINILGKGEVFAVRWNHYLPRRGEYTSKVVFGYDHKKIDTCLAGVCGAPVTLDPLSLTYTGQKLGAGHVFDYNLSVAGAGRPDFTAYRLNTALMQALPDDWALRLSFNAQYSPRLLPDAEKFGVAGSTGVRGFFERAVTGDNGFVYTVEAYTPDMIKVFEWPGSIKFVGFIDVGQGYSYLTRATTEIAAMGVGLRYGLGKQVALRTDIAWVAKAGNTGLIAPSPDTNVRKEDIRGHFALQLTF